MPENDIVLKGVCVEKKAIFKLEDLFNCVKKWLKLHKYDVVEKTYKEIPKSGSKNIDCGWQADKKIDAYNWLRSAGLSDIVKNEITVRFGREEDNKAQQYATLAKGQGYDPEQKVSVHAGTLRLTLEDYHTRGGKIPSEFFNTFEKNQTQLKNKPKQ